MDITTETTVKAIESSDALATSADISADIVHHFASLFPGLVTEGKAGAVIDVDVLRQLVGDRTVTGVDERFGLSWHGKARARQVALTPSTGTLRPSQADSVEWERTRHLLIEGDNLEVLKLLQKSYSRKVKAIYIDPPYNTGRNLIYPNDYQDGVQTYLEITGQASGGTALTSNPVAGGRFHTNWLSMVYPRLMLARQLLAEDGVLVITIDDNEQPTLGVVLREIFEEGSYDHVCVPVVHNPRGVQGENFSYVHEYAFFVFRSGTKAIGNRKIAEADVDWSQFRNWGTESERADAKNCFYAVMVKGDEIVGFGDVSPDNVHPQQTETRNGVSFVYPIDRSGIERKWRYARQSVDAVRHLLRAKRTSGGYEIEIGKDFGLYKTVWTDKRYDANEYGTKIVSELVPGSPFTYPKSLWAVYDTLVAIVGDDPDAIVLDFFAGSGTTGHALMELNKVDHGSRRFILVQLPEPIEEKSSYKTIFDVMKARIAAVGQRMRATSSGNGRDLGYRVFKLDSSNIRAWNTHTTDLAGDLLAHEDHILPGRSDADILFELLLKVGLDLCVPMEQRKIAGKTVHSIGGGVLIACFAAEITAEEVEPVAQGIVQWHQALRPAGDTTCVFRDSAFSNDVAKTNLAAILYQHGIEKVRSL